MELSRPPIFATILHSGRLALVAGPEERQGLEAKGPWWTVSVARYAFALPYVEAARVLDVAAGTGYGLELLAGPAKCVIGVDRDVHALRNAPGGRRRIALVRADACRLPLRPATLDVVTSFETIEHLDCRPTFVAELARVLRPGGLCILSTPNARHTEPIDGRPRNPFHKHEYLPTELRQELSQGFGEVELLGQRLDARIAVSPFLHDQLRLMRQSPRSRLRVLLWRLLNRLPSFLQDRLARLAWGHSFAVQPGDFVISKEGFEEAPVLVALCRSPKGGSPA